MRKTVFLDRDGLLNKKARPHEYVTTWGDFEFLPGVPGAIRTLNMAGYQAVVVTNQRGIARGLAAAEDVDGLHDRMRAELEKQGARIDGIYVCPHEEGACACRKPQIGLFLMAEKDFGIDKEASWMVGDSDSDVEAGRRYGIKTILTASLPEAVEMIMKAGNEGGGK